MALDIKKAVKGAANTITKTVSGGVKAVKKVTKTVSGGVKAVKKVAKTVSGGVKAVNNVVKNAAKTVTNTVVKGVKTASSSKSFSITKTSKQYLDTGKKVLDVANRMKKDAFKAKNMVGKIEKFLPAIEKTGALSKVLSKTGKFVARVGGKKIPYAGIAVSTVMIADDIAKKDYVQAGFNTLSTAAAQVPVAGTALSLGIDNEAAKFNIAKKMVKDVKEKGKINPMDVLAVVSPVQGTALATDFVNEVLGAVGVDMVESPLAVNVGKKNPSQGEKVLTQKDKDSKTKANPNQTKVNPYVMRKMAGNSRA